MRQVKLGIQLGSQAQLGNQKNQFLGGAVRRARHLYFGGTGFQACAGAG